MSVTSTRKVGTSSPNRVIKSNNHSQLVEDIDTKNAVLLHNETQNHDDNQYNPKRSSPNFITSELDDATVLETLNFVGIEDNNEENVSPDHDKINIYSNNQSIIKDTEIESIGRNYLKHFYEKNEPITDINELV